MRKEVVVIICDICGEKINENEVSDMKIEVNGEKLTDVCNSCAKKISDFIKSSKRNGE